MVPEWLLQPNEEVLSRERPDSHSVAVEQPVVALKRKTVEDMRVNPEKEPAELPVFAERSDTPNTSQPTGNHNVFTLSPKDTNCELCQLTHTPRAQCKNRPARRPHSSSTKIW